MSSWKKSKKQLGRQVAFEADWLLRDIIVLGFSILRAALVAPLQSPRKDEEEQGQ